MKKLVSTLLLIPTLIVVLSGCGTSGPSPEQKTREAQQQQDAERQQAEFRKGLPAPDDTGFASTANASLTLSMRLDARLVSTKK